MKYIRNESGIYEVVKSNSRSTEFIYPTKKGIRFCQRQNKKCKFADTIKELCDEFVVAYEDGARIVYGDLEWAKVKAKASLVAFDDKSIIYGAIWTDKGLKYVAKTNDQGELELL